MEFKEVRLPSEVKPVLYKLSLVPDLTACTFQGFIDITIDVASPTDSITLHSIDLWYPDAEKIKLTRKFVCLCVSACVSDIRVQTEPTTRSSCALVCRSTCPANALPSSLAK